ncbi:MAG: hypothetical protein K2L12_05880 [Clostridia bacterium]|nr:hypothetical protein [Clostridia bacterium]
MEPKYIVAIAAIGLFSILFLIFFMLLAYRRRVEANLQAYIHEVYSDKNLIKIDYDSAANEEVPKNCDLFAAFEGSQAKKKEEEETQLKIEEVFSKMEIEGIEEITGNYQP